MRKRLETLTALSREICAEERRKADVKAVLLFGSVASGAVHSESDLDIVVVSSKQAKPIVRNRHERVGVTVDLWRHALSNYESLFRRDWNPPAMFLYSLFLNIVQESAILYDGDGSFRMYKEEAANWSWPQACKLFIEQRWKRGLGTFREAQDSFEKLTAMRRLFLVRAAQRLLELGRPVSIRNKDYYLVFSKPSSELPLNDFKQAFGRIAGQKELEELVKRGFSMFAAEVPEREPWTELLDAKKHLTDGDCFLAALSLQNGLYYLGCRGLKNRGVRLVEKGYLWPESELELIRKARQGWPEFYVVYEKIHNAKSWRLGEVTEFFEKIFP